MRIHTLMAALTLATGVGSSPSAIASPKADCCQACAAANLRVSCAWVARKTPRCVHHGIRDCIQRVRTGGPVECRPPADLPGCQTNHTCPFGSLCVDGACQVVPCGPAPNATACAASTACQGDKCVVSDCGGTTANCPAGLHCETDPGQVVPTTGVCAPDEPGIHYCTVDTDCIIPLEPNLVCRRGRCEPRNRRRRSTTTSTTSTTATTLGGTPCFDVFDCPGGASACCGGQCVPDPYAGRGTCTEIYTPACTLCTTDDDCACSGIFCDACGGSASLSGCVDPCASGLVP